MLGKGLESLIPPQKKPQGDDGAVQNIQQPEDNAIQAPQSDSGDTGAPQTLPVFPVDDSTVVDKPQFAGDDFRAAVYAKPAEPQRERVKVKEPIDSVFHIEVIKIKPNPNQPRKHFDEQALWELANSIREFGFLQPLVVSKTDKEISTGVDVEYQIIAGERRFLAAKLLGLEVVPAIIRNVDLEREKLELAVVENIQREDLNPIEKARAVARLQEEFRMTQREIAAKLGKSRESVANSVRLLDLPMYIQEALEKGQLTESHGRFLLAVQDPGAQKQLFDDIVLHGITTRELRNRVRAGRPRGVSREAGLPPELRMMEEKLSSELGTPVKIEKDGASGKITITFYSDEELESIMRKIGKEEV
ncbi:MAG: ParB/RepB/Spo0J family partition protein [Patescibacteria group bacterium]|nr:ParB/RepB/Spo0J family partition protein [Patescibacteria group bacterium]MDE2015329.1 ParB/RepB/Spo0J family partition protein [Patescibacteria group bacterium]MDE2227134.1 ParB/RepB/Spo0J family partition protein [Patescibacteria group bacterium]